MWLRCCYFNCICAWLNEGKSEINRAIRSFFLLGPSLIQTATTDIKEDEQEMVSMSGDRQRSASSSVVQEGSNSTTKDSPLPSTSAATALSGLKDKKMTTNSISAAASASNKVGSSSGPPAISGNNGMSSAGGGSMNIPAPRRGTQNSSNPEQQAQLHYEESPNHIVYRKVSF